MKKVITLLLFLIHLNLLGQVDSLYSTPSVEDVLKEYKLDEVTVSGYSSTLSNNNAGQYKLRFDNLDQIPQFMGAIDAIRALQLMPGIQTTGDISSGLSVQGCEPAHNLFLLDNAPIYNPTHLLGFIPVLSSNHMESISIDKGYISAATSGRLAAVVQCNSKDEWVEKPEVSGEINILSAALTVNSPTGTKSNLIASARVCYVNAMLNLVEKSLGENLPFGYSQYDFNATWNYRPTKKDKIYISGYYGSDDITIASAGFISSGDSGWKNGVVSAGYSHDFSKKSTFSASLYNTYYSDKTFLDQDVIAFDLQSKINDFGGKLEHKLELNSNLKLLYGADFSFRVVNPQSTQLSGLSSAFDIEPQAAVNNLELGVWAEGELQLSKRVKTTAGLRYAGVVSECGGLEPRFKLDYQIAADLTSTFSYTRQYQYINQVIVSSTGLPVNYYIPATEQSPPQRSDNLSIEASYKSPKRKWSFTALGYYKWLENQYENISSLTTLIIEDTPIYDRFVTSTGENYGLEAILRYNLGSFSGWCSYTLSWALRKSDQLNDGYAFYANNDRRHDLSVVGTWVINPKWRISSNFILASGTPFTQSTGLMIMGEQPVSYYSDRNEGTMPTYTRLDVSVNRKLKIKWFKDSTLNFGVYNIYARHNPFYFHYKLTVEDDNLTILDRGSALFTILPIFGISFKM